MKRKLILMAIIAFSGFSIEANAAVNDEALSNVQNKMIEYINNYSFTNNADESATEGTTNNTVDFNWSDYVNNAGNVYKDAVEQIVSELLFFNIDSLSIVYITIFYIIFQLNFFYSFLEKRTVALNN